MQSRPLSFILFVFHSLFQVTLTRDNTPRPSIEQTSEIGVAGGSKKLNTAVVIVAITHIRIVADRGCWIRVSFGGPASIITALSSK
jgi:hypothetical protein